jgi:hypothetical protein
MECDPSRNQGNAEPQRLQKEAENPPYDKADHRRILTLETRSAIKTMQKRYH